jgi:hypothetical protein
MIVIGTVKAILFHGGIKVNLPAYKAGLFH